MSVPQCPALLISAPAWTDLRGVRAEMPGVLPGHAVVQEKLANLGLHRIALPEGTLHDPTFHYSRMESPLVPIAHSQSARHHGTGEPVYHQGRLTASYLHGYFLSNPAVAARLFLP